MIVECYVPDCKETKKMPWYIYVCACICALSLRPWVCVGHYDLFDEEPEQNE